jgi:hypothetical protein
MKIFGEFDLSQFLEARLQQVAREVAAEVPDRLLGMNETRYVEYLTAQARVEPLALDWVGCSVSDCEAMIPAEWFPGGGFAYAVEPGQRYRKQVVAYHIPFEGDASLLRCAPSTRLMWTTDVAISGASISFDVVNFSNNPELIKGEAESTIKNLKTQHGYLTQQVDAFNEQLDTRVRELVSLRKGELLKRSNLLDSLGVPIRRTSDIAQSFAVPITRKSLIVKPSAPSAKFQPEPTISDADYRAILEVVHDLGVNMERLPSIYTGKDEEALRDLLVMQLSPHFASVTGETFNKSGKTDVLIRHDGQNVFIAECKFWRGPKAHLATIDQILSYLTWRDSKAAIVSFIQNKELAPVLEHIRPITAEHPCFVKDRGAIKPGWFQFELHMANDQTRRVFLAVLCFHLPSV